MVNRAINIFRIKKTRMAHVLLSLSLSLPPSLPPSFLYLALPPCIIANQS